MADLRSLVASLRRYPDPATSADPVASALVARLAALPAGPRPSPRFRAELRAQLVAVTPRLVAEGAADLAVERQTRRRTGGRVRATWRRVPLHRPLAVVGTLVVIFALLLTGAVWLSTSTLPGDSLYGLKRASENVQLSLTSGAVPRGKEYLSLAKKRTDEVSALLSRASALAAGRGMVAAGGVNAHTAKLATDTLDDSDSDLRNASRLLTGQAVRSMSDGPLQNVMSWSPGQISRLTGIVDRIPLGPLHDRAAASEQLAERVLDRANRLHADMGCSCLTSTSSDDLGPLPCTGPCSITPSAPSHPGSNAPVSPGRSGGGASKAPSRSPSASPKPGGLSLPGIPGLPGSGTGHPVSGSPPGGSVSTTPAAPTSGGAGLSLPGGASSPVTVDSCGLSITLGSIGLGLGPCGIKLHL